ncbi:MAG: succinate dehydrogenase, cytochrome b556 subunit [Chloroflexi bacterium]|nr:succinate dehydrogenase, cytochrome b556 subunit [Chloroflexota bacterium]
MVQGLLGALTYRGSEGQWAWLLHRLSGIGVLLFLALHILDIFLLGLGPGVFDELLFIYKAPPFRVMEVFLIFGVLYHAINGIRIMIIDFWPQSTLVQRTLFRVELVIVAIIFIPAAIAMLAPIFRG